MSKRGRKHVEQAADVSVVGPVRLGVRQEGKDGPVVESVRCAEYGGRERARAATQQVAVFVGSQHASARHASRCYAVTIKVEENYKLSF